MDILSFRIDIIAGILVIIGFVLGVFFMLRSRNYERPHIKLPNIGTLKKIPLSHKERLSHLPRSLSFVALIFFILAFIDPYLIEKKDRDSNKKRDNDTISTEGAALYLLLDNSSSMMTPLSGTERHSRMEMLRDVTKKFISGDVESGLPGRDGDLIGIISFARVATVIAPLTSDHTILIEKLNDFTVVQHDHDDGTALGYAIFKTTNLIIATRDISLDSSSGSEASYDITDSALIVLTDGFQNPNPLDKNNNLRSISISKAAQYAAKNNVTVYIVNIDPLIRQPRYKTSCELLKDAAETTGGAFFIADDANALHTIYAKIDSMERSKVPIQSFSETDNDEKNSPIPHRRLSYYPYLIGIALCLFFISLFLEILLFRRTV